MAAIALKLDQTGLLVVDLQEKLLPHIHESDRVIAQCGKLLDGANALGMPVVATEQYPKGLGPTVETIAQRLESLDAPVHEKLKFSACIEAVRHDLSAKNIRAVVVCGIESHVCILQTCLELMNAGFITALVVDAVGSRKPVDHETAVRRMEQAGVIPTTVESILLELVGEAGTDRFKAILPIIR